MKFDLSDDQKAIRHLAASFLGDSLPREGAVARAQRGALDRNLWAQANDLGLSRILVAEDLAGLGLDLLTLAVVADAIGEAAAPLPIASQAMAAWALAQDTGVAPGLLGGVMDGSVVAAFALAEEPWPERWSDMADGGPIRRLVEFGPDADILIVGASGPRLGYVELKNARIEPVRSLDGTRPLAEVEFSPGDIRWLTVPAGVLDRLGEALVILRAADSRGVARTVLTMACDYAKVREQFGRPIGSFQALQHQLADMAVEVEPCEPLLWYAAYTWDAIPDEATRFASLAKAHICDVAVRTARAATEAHGGIGYTWEYPLHVWLKRAMVNSWSLGTTREHRVRAALAAPWLLDTRAAGSEAKRVY